jgi:hypothetical protein
MTKPLANAVSEVGEGCGVRGRGWGDLTNVQCKLIWNCHKESSLCNKYILILKKTVTEDTEVTDEMYI